MPTYQQVAQLLDEIKKEVFDGTSVIMDYWNAMHPGQAAPKPIPTPYADSVGAKIQFEAFQKWADSHLCGEVATVLDIRSQFIHHVNANTPQAVWQQIFLQIPEDLNLSGPLMNQLDQAINEMGGRPPVGRPRAGGMG
jgi:hypothetical protein